MTNSGLKQLEKEILAVLDAVHQLRKQPTSSPAAIKDLGTIYSMVSGLAITATFIDGIESQQSLSNGSKKRTPKGGSIYRRNAKKPQNR